MTVRNSWGTAVLGEPTHMCGLYSSEPKHVLPGKIWECCLCDSGERRGRVIIVESTQSLPHDEGLLSRGKLLPEPYPSLGRAFLSPRSVRLPVSMARTSRKERRNTAAREGWRIQGPSRKASSGLQLKRCKTQAISEDFLGIPKPTWKKKMTLELEAFVTFKYRRHTM